MMLDEERGVFLPRILDAALATGAGPEFDVCPGKGVPIAEIARRLYGSAPNISFELGRYRLGLAARAADERILENASSGGVMVAIAKYLMDKGLVDGATACRFSYGEPGPRTEVYLATSFDELLASQGSKYCPTSMNTLVRKCTHSGRRYLFIGTPCQVAALRLAMRADAAIKQTFPFTMANFCGGYRDFRCLDDIIRSHGLDPAEVCFFRFRGGGQPGSMLVRTRTGREACEAYPDYAGRSSVPKQKRCWYCIDATGELADFACGDAWVDRFLQDRHNWSIILARSEPAEEIINQMNATNYIVSRPVSAEEICRSQQDNLRSKKFRQKSRMRASRMLGIAMPRWDVTLPASHTSTFYELSVLLGKTRPGRYVRLLLGRIKSLLPTRRKQAEPFS